MSRDCVRFVGALLAGLCCREVAAREWTQPLLHDASVWPAGAGIQATTNGLRITVPEGRGHAIAACGDLTLPAFNRIRVQVRSVEGGTWFLRLYGPVRRVDERRTIAVTQGEPAAGERSFHFDPRLRTRREAPLQLQLGVEGPAGASVVFGNVEFVTEQRTNVLPRGVRQPGQNDIATVELMPNCPAPFEIIDWREKAVQLDRLAFGPRQQGEFLPLVWWDDPPMPGRCPAFGLPSYVGGSQRRGAQEAITCLGAVLGATVAGIDKSGPGSNYVSACTAWFNPEDGQNIVLNNQRGRAGGSFWYDLLPGVLCWAIADRYPLQSNVMNVAKATSDRWMDVVHALRGTNELPDFNHTAFDVKTGQPVDNGKWREPDAAAGVAWMEYSAYQRFGGEDRLAASRQCIAAMLQTNRNPYYEALLPFGALTAARLNAERGDRHDVDRLLNACFEPSDIRGGWGVLTGRWGGYDCDGLVGSIDNQSGYAFSMNTFLQAGALVPVARYDMRYARAIGKWMLNLANAARLFYPGAVTPSPWEVDTTHAVAFEGLRHAWRGGSPVATGDPVAMQWGPKTDLGVYGSAYAGLLGGIIRRTSNPEILALDCLATDFHRPPAYPTFLVYNPRDTRQEVTIDVGKGPVDLYDALQDAILVSKASGVAHFDLPANHARLLVCVPTGAEFRREGGRTLAASVVVRWPLPSQPR